MGSLSFAITVVVLHSVTLVDDYHTVNTLYLDLEKSNKFWC